MLSESGVLQPLVPVSRMNMPANRSVAVPREISLRVIISELGVLVVGIMEAMVVGVPGVLGEQAEGGADPWGPAPRWVV